jgi:hypothetical protein
LRAVNSHTKSVDGQAAQMNAVVRADIDGDGIARGNPDGRDSDSVVDDADRLADDHRAIVGRVEHVDLTAGVCLGEREGKSLARRGARAGATIGSRSGNKSLVWSCLRWRGGKAAGEKRSGDGL